VSCRDEEWTMFERVEISRQPMLYITTSCSARPSTIATEVKASLATVREFLDRHAIKALGPAIVSYGDMDGRLVTIEAGYPVSLADAASAQGRVLAGHTPVGPAATKIHRGSPTTLEAARSDFGAEVRQEGALVTGLSWERYLDGDGTGPGSVTQLYVQLLEPPASLPDEGLPPI
jgi:effector-binding domain-containing protein